MMSLQCSGIQRLDILRCTMVAVFLWIQGAMCLNFASTNGVRQEREKVLTLDLPGHHSHSSLHLCPSYFPTTLHLLPPGPPPNPPSQSCGNLCLSSHLLFHWPASITSSGLKSLADIASLANPIQMLNPTWLTLNYLKDHFEQLKWPVYHNASFKLTPIVIC